MRKVIIDGWYQLPEVPSVPYTPSNFWNTMHMIEDVKIVEAEKPPTPSHLSDYREPDYGAVFYMKPHDVIIHYKYDGTFFEATVELFGDRANIGKVEEIIREEHRRQYEKLREYKASRSGILADLVIVRPR